LNKKGVFNVYKGKNWKMILHELNNESQMYKTGIKKSRMFFIT